jgi:hypothetical protein
VGRVYDRFGSQQEIILSEGIESHKAYPATALGSVSPPETPSTVFYPMQLLIEFPL